MSCDIDAGNRPSDTTAELDRVGALIPIQMPSKKEVRLTWKTHNSVPTLMGPKCEAFVELYEFPETILLVDLYCPSQLNCPALVKDYRVAVATTQLNRWYYPGQGLTSYPPGRGLYHFP